MSTPAVPPPVPPAGDVDVHAALREPAHQVSPTARALWAVGAVVRGLVLVAALVAADLLDWWALPWWGWALLVPALVAYAALMPLVRYRVHRWESTETAVYTQVGWLSRERRIAPMSKVQTVDLEQSPVARALGLATVTVTTASAAGPLTITGIDKPVADRLVADLTRRTESEAGDAT
ncbi:PH domain-containing protein [Nocardioides aequoreus]|uniref:PH domain-containing protein n=1 Tax=Nocardioides aequoreus TaxID=397278 RepID=UPI00055FD7BA|nr:PH domain-containing protein [Nocardioides aequoreus]